MVVSTTTVMAADFLVQYQVAALLHSYHKGSHCCHSENTLYFIFIFSMNARLSLFDKRGGEGDVMIYMVMDTLLHLLLLTMRMLD